jgi:transposase-like protein
MARAQENGKTRLDEAERLDLLRQQFEVYALVDQSAKAAKQLMWRAALACYASGTPSADLMEVLGVSSAQFWRELRKVRGPRSQ